jgi:PAS domain S-box-containing protein
MDPSRRKVELLQHFAALHEQAAGDDPARLIEELRAQQIQLQLQNEQLQETRADLEVLHARYAEIFDSAPIGYCLLGRTGLIEEINLAGAALLGRDRRHLVGRPLIAVAGVVDKRALLAHLARCVDGGERVEDELTLEQGSRPLTVLITSVPIRLGNGTVVGCRTTLADITALKDAEQQAHRAHAQAAAAHAREAFLSEASARMAAMISKIELQAVAQVAVPWLAETCAVEITAEPHDHCLGVASTRNVKLELDATPPPDRVRAELFDDLSAALAAAADDPVRRALLEATRPLSLIVVPIGAGDARIGRMLLASGHRCYVADDLALAEELARRVAQALEHSFRYDALQRALRTRDDVLSMVTHDLKQSLHGVRLLLRADAPAGTVSHCLDLTIRLVDDLVVLCSIDADALTVRPAAHEVGAIVEQAIQLIQPASEVRIEKDVPEGLTVFCDDGRLLQVLLNLLGNAAKFTPGGTSVFVRARAEGDWVRFSVEDTGPGIGIADQPRVFERYWRAQPERFPGMGLGLFISKEIVEAHGGTIWVESTPGHGCTFHFKLARTE